MYHGNPLWHGERSPYICFDIFFDDIFAMAVTAMPTFPAGLMMGHIMPFMIMKGTLLAEVYQKLTRAMHYANKHTCSE